MPVLLTATRGHRAARMNWLESEKPLMASRSGSMRSSTPTRTATARALVSGGRAAAFAPAFVHIPFG
jgi:hypothetical protein